MNEELLPGSSADPRVQGLSFDAVMALPGVSYRRAPGRETLRVEHRGHDYFLKRHTGVGWGEILKNLCSLRLPVVSAANEYRAIAVLNRLGLDTLTAVAFERRGWNPARRRSYLLTEPLGDTVSLEDLCRDWPARQWDPAGLRQKRYLLRRVAEIARVLHGNGINHRDFYLCHFHLPRAAATCTERHKPPLFLIDLHRAQLRRHTPRRWRVKDIGGLYFSALDVGLTRRDCYRFIRLYGGKPLKRALTTDARFWRQVTANAVYMYRKAFGRVPELPLG